MGRSSDAVAVAATMTLGPSAETRLRGIATELQPDGTITRRELSAEELAEAIRAERG